MSKYMEAYKQAQKDIRAELRREGKSYITCSLKQLAAWSVCIDLLG